MKISVELSSKDEAFFGPFKKKPKKDYKGMRERSLPKAGTNRTNKSEYQLHSAASPLSPVYNAMPGAWKKIFKMRANSLEADMNSLLVSVTMKDTEFLVFTNNSFEDFKTLCPDVSSAVSTISRFFKREHAYAEGTVRRLKPLLSK